MENPPLAQLAEATVLRTVQSEFESLKGDHPIFSPPDWTIYGPYQSKQDLRRRVIARRGLEQITISYPKFIMECYLKKILKDNEEIHHINTIEFDDRIENYEIKLKGEHIRQHQTKMPESFICPVCNSIFTLEGLKLSRLKTNIKLGRQTRGPYCSRSCAGKENN